MGLYGNLHLQESDAQNGLLYATPPLSWLSWSFGFLCLGGLLLGFELNFPEVMNSLAEDPSLLGTIPYWTIRISGPLYLSLGIFFLGLTKAVRINAESSTVFIESRCFSIPFSKKVLNFTPKTVLDVVPSRIIEAPSENGTDKKEIGPWKLLISNSKDQKVVLDRNLHAKPLIEIRERMLTCLQH